jgi:hypothetical protein
MTRYRMALMLFIILATIALAATVASLTLQAYMGAQPVLVRLEQVLAALGGAAFAFWLSRPR